MTFQTYEVSRSFGEPVNLYLFLHGAGDEDYYGYTDAETAVSFDDRTYQPVAISRDSIKSSGTLDKSSMTISTAGDTAVAELFRVYPPAQIVTLVILQGHINDGDGEFLAVWTGRVLSCKWVRSEAELTCEPVATSMKRAGLRRHYQYGCPHALYMGDESGGCRANKVAATQTSTASTISGNTISLPAGWNGVRDKPKFIGGLLEWTTTSGAVERRTILRITGDVLTVSGIIRNLAVGGTVKAILGCNHQMSDCKDLHDNILDYGGQPWIPTKNPYGLVNNFY